MGILVGVAGVVGYLDDLFRQKTPTHLKNSETPLEGITEVKLGKFQRQSLSFQVFRPEQGNPETKSNSPHSSSIPILKQAKSIKTFTMYYFITSAFCRVHKHPSRRKQRLNPHTPLAKARIFCWC